jgi:hypothetical protein
MLTFAMACPVRLRRGSALDRAMHREAMASLLPPEVLERKSKANFDFVSRCTLETLKRDHFPRDVVFDWLDLRPEEVFPLINGLGAATEPSWADWSAWSLLGCGMLAGSIDIPGKSANSRDSGV